MSSFPIRFHSQKVGSLSYAVFYSIMTFFPPDDDDVPYSRVIRRISPISAYPLLGGGFCS